MWRTGTRALAPLTTPAAPRSSAGKQKRSLPGVLADPRVRLGVGVAALLATAGGACRNRVGPWEATAIRAVNGLVAPARPGRPQPGAASCTCVAAAA